MASKLVESVLRIELIKSAERLQVTVTHLPLPRRRLMAEVFLSVQTLLLTDGQVTLGLCVTIYAAIADVAIVTIFMPMALPVSKEKRAKTRSSF